MAQVLSRSVSTNRSPPRRAEVRALRRVEQWELVERVAEGSLAEVYRARVEGSDPDQPPPYAVKILRPPWRDDSRAIAMMRREAVLGHKVRHPRVISILAAGVFLPPYFLVMPWLQGQTLAARLTAGRLPPSMAFWIARQAAEALVALEDAGWTHGDVKPGNLFLSPQGHVTLLDLGFARRIGAGRGGGGRIVTGTCHYLAPELATESWPADIRSDVYSLGAVLFEMLAGRLPFPAADAAAAIRHHCRTRPPELASFAPGLPRDAAELVRRMLAKEPLRRPAPREAIPALCALEIATLAGPFAR